MSVLTSSTSASAVWGSSLHATKKKWTLSELQKLKEVRSFPMGKHSQRVSLLENKVVAKYHTIKQKPHFDRELQILTQLTGCTFVPRLLGSTVTNDQCILYMSYCGEQVPFYDKSVRRRVKQLVKELSERWGIGRWFLASKLPKQHNVTLLDGRLKLIDFNSGQWIIKQNTSKLQRNHQPNAPAALVKPIGGGESI